MPDGVVGLEWKLDTKNAEARLQQLSAAQETLTKKFGAGKEAVNKADKELERFAKRVEQIETTPLEKLHREADMISRSMAAGIGNVDKLTLAYQRNQAAQESARRAAMESSGMKFVTPATLQARAVAGRDAFINAKADPSHYQANPMAALTTPKVDWMQLQRSKTNDSRDTQRLAAIKRLTESEKAWGDAVGQANKKAQLEYGKSQQKARDLADAMKGAGQTGESAISGTIESLKSYISVAGLSALAVRAIGEAWQFHNEQRDAGGQSVKDDFSVIQGLTELSDSPAQLDTRIKEYQNLRSNYGLSREAASTMQETAISTGNEASLERFASTQGVGDPSERFKAAARLETLSGGKVNEVQADAGIWSASVPSQFKATELAKYTPKAAEAMGQQGTSVPELMGTYSVFADQFKGPDTGAERLNTLQSKFAADKRFKGLGLNKAVEQLQALPEENREDFLKDNMELRNSYNKFIENKPEIQKRQKQVVIDMQAVGTANDPILKRQKIFEGNPLAKAALDNRIAEQKLEASKRDKFGVDRVQGETFQQRIEARDIEQNKSWWSRKWSSVGAWSAGQFGADEKTTAATAGAYQKVAEVGGQSFLDSASGVGPAIRTLLERIAASNERMANEPRPPRAMPDQSRRRETAPGG